jgi:hypothetical protein
VQGQLQRPEERRRDAGERLESSMGFTWSRLGGRPGQRWRRRAPPQHAGWPSAGSRCASVLGCNARPKAAGISAGDPREGKRQVGRRGLESGATKRARRLVNGGRWRGRHGGEGAALRDWQGEQRRGMRSWNLPIYPRPRGNGQLGRPMRASRAAFTPASVWPCRSAACAWTRHTELCRQRAKDRSVHRNVADAPVRRAALQSPRALARTECARGRHVERDGSGV